MPFKPEEIDASTLPVAFRGYAREATDELLMRVAWDYKRAVQAQADQAKVERRLNERIAELEQQLTAQQAQSARAQQAEQGGREQELHARITALGAEIARLQAAVHAHEERESLMRTLVTSAQRSARELRESARAECEALLKAAHRRAVEIEDEAHASVRSSAREVDRLRKLESDLRDQLRHTLESVLGTTEPQPDRAPTTSVD